MRPGRKLIIWLLQLGRQKTSVDRNETGGSKGNLDHIVVGLGHVVEDLVGSHKDRLRFVKLSLFREAGGGDLDEISNIVLWRETTTFVCLLHHCNTALDELRYERITKSIGYHVRSARGSRDDDSLFEIERDSNAKSVRGGVPRSINTTINCHLHRGKSSQPVQSLG